MPAALPDVVMRGGAQLCVMGVRVMVGVSWHGRQVGSAVHASKIRGSVRGRVALGVAGSLVVGHGIRRHSC